MKTEYPFKINIEKDDEDMQLLDDGSLLILLTQQREDGSANELMFFRLTGF